MNISFAKIFLDSLAYVKKYVCNINDNVVRGRLSKNYCKKYFGHEIFMIYSTSISEKNTNSDQATFVLVYSKIIILTISVLVDIRICKYKFLCLICDYNPNCRQNYQNSAFTTWARYLVENFSSSSSSSSSKLALYRCNLHLLL